jgi:hypothetical protein
MKNWNNISEKIPKINTLVFIFGTKKTRIHHSKLKVFAKQEHIDNSENTLKEGDVFWESKEENKWYSIEDYPYWLTNKELVKLTTKEIKGTESLNRFDIMDI